MLFRSLADAEVYAKVDHAAHRISSAVTQALTLAGVPHRLQRNGNMFSVFFTDADVTDYRGASAQDTNAYRVFFHAMLEAGCHLPPSAFEAWFVSAAHDEEAIEHEIAALHAAAAAVAASITH